MTAAPDLVEPLVGFRAWRPGDAGELVPWSAGRQGTWERGVNVAACLRDGRPEHVAPGPQCSCGLYALADADDPRLVPGREAVGAIVAWGDVEVHRTGFRAQYAAIVALALPERAAPGHRERLEAAAHRYGVPLVPAVELRSRALEHGRPVAFEALPRRRAAPDGTAPPLVDGGALGVALDEHLRVEVCATGLRLRLTAELARALPPRPAVWMPEPGTAVRQGDPLLRLGAGREDGVILGAPVCGIVERAGDGDAGGPWLLGLAPTRWEEQAADLAWGAAARRGYAAQLSAAARRGEDPFRFVRAGWLHANAHVRSAADVREALRALRDAPRFASAAEVEARVAGRLRRALAVRPVARAVLRLPVRICWRLHAPEADLLLDLTGETPAVRTGEPPAPGDLVIHAAAATVDDFLLGRLDVPAALRRRELQSSAPRSAVLRAASVLKAVQPAYAAASPGAVTAV